MKLRLVAVKFIFICEEDAICVSSGKVSDASCEL